MFLRLLSETTREMEGTTRGIYGLTSSSRDQLIPYPLNPVVNLLERYTMDLRTDPSSNLRVKSYSIHHGIIKNLEKNRHSRSPVRVLLFPSGKVTG